MSTQSHWDDVYDSRPSEELGWYEPVPSTLGLVLQHSKPTDAVIDIGGGDSALASELLAAGYGEVSVLDLSDTGLGRARDRLGRQAGRVEWIHADVTAWKPHRTWDLWHDRAVFHFLTTPNERAAYKTTALDALADDGRLVVATFSTDGPERCAGLPVERYDPDRLTAAFEPDFRVVTIETFPSGLRTIGDQRPYIAAVFQPA